MATDAGLIPELPTCVPPPKLPEELVIAAADDAVRLHPPNAPRVSGLQLISAALEALGQPPLPPPTPYHIAALTSMYWGQEPRTLTVSFMERQSQDFMDKVVATANLWKGCIRYRLAAAGKRGDIRISTGPGGYWSYLGVSIRQIPMNQPTMNLQEFSMATPQSEWMRVPTHEFGHSRGYIHEHLRAAEVAKINPALAIPFYMRTQGWSQQDVIEQVLKAQDEADLMATPADESSIMCYFVPASVTYDHVAIAGGTHINDNDQALDLKIYPVAVTPTPTPPPTATPITLRSGDTITKDGRVYVYTSVGTLTPR